MWQTKYAMFFYRDNVSSEKGTSQSSKENTRNKR